jgi:NosR/NirI family nitrous oxide reductase transcriptional regulator
MIRRLRGPLLAFTALLLASAPATGQGVNRVRQSVLNQVVPGADRFDSASGSPPVRRAFKGDSLIAYVFMNTDLPPPVFGYAGPIETVIGMTPDGTLTGVRVTEYHETYMRTRGDFLHTPGFEEQFTGKSVGDPYRVREDVDGISRVTISVRAMARGVRQSARQVAAAYMRMPTPSEEPVEDLTSLTWFDMRARGLAPRFEVNDPSRDSPLGISVMHLETEALGRYLVGDLYNYMQRATEERGGVDDMLLYVVDGTTPRLETEQGWSIEQDGKRFVVPTGDVRMLGAPWEGILLGETSMVGIIMLGSGDVDISRPMSVHYDGGADLGTYVVAYTSERAKEVMAEAAAVAASAEALAVAAATPVETTTAADAASTAPATTSAEDAAEAQATTIGPDPRAAFSDLDIYELDDGPEQSALERLLADASWGRMSWIALVIGLALLAFFTKKAALRWVSLAATFIVLGYVDGGFLSVSHITAAIWVGPSVFLGDLALLVMITFTIVAVIFFGRIFCGYLCPFGALQDFIDAIVPKRFQKELPRNIHRVAFKAKYGILAIIVLPALMGSETSLYQYFEPFGTVFSIGPSRLLWTIAGAILLSSAIVPRFYCRYMCPLGAALAIGSVVSLNRIKRVEQCGYCKVCEQKCPTGAIDKEKVDFKECVRCNVCEIELIQKAGVCRHDMEAIRPRLVQLKTRTPAGLADVAVRGRQP